MSNIQVYMQVKANGSDIEGDSEDKNNHEGWCDVLDFTYDVTKGDANQARASRIAGGRTVAGQFLVRKPIDKASPLLLQALAQNQTVEVVLELWRDKPEGGGREKFFTYQLKDARCVVMKPETNGGPNADAAFPYVETVGFVSGVIVITHVDGGIEFEHNFMHADS